MGMKELVDELAAKRTRARAMGGEEAVARQHAAGRPAVGERLALLFNAGTLTEIGVQATHAGIAPDLAGRETPADGVVTGFGRIAGRLAAGLAPRLTAVG